MNNKDFKVGDRVKVRGNVETQTTLIDGKEGIITHIFRDGDCLVLIPNSSYLPYYVYKHDLTLLPDKLAEAQEKINYYRNKNQELAFKIWELKGKLKICEEQRDKFRELYVKEYWDSKGLSEKLDVIKQSFGLEIQKDEV